MLAIVLSASLTLESCADLCSKEAIRHYARLNAAAAMTRHESERGALLVRRLDDHLFAVPWKPGEKTGASYTGQIPGGCIAIIHTHPSTAPEPSANDVAEAKRLRLPIVVITPDGITAAMPDGARVRLLDRGWNH